MMCKWFGMVCACLVLCAPSGGWASEPVIVDIRTAAEWHATGVIEDAILMTFFAEDGSYDADRFVAALAAEVGPDAPILLVCRSGRRTQAVLPLLEKSGFRHVDHIEGGIRRWRAEGRAVVMPFSDSLARTTGSGRAWR